MLRRALEQVDASDHAFVRTLLKHAGGENDDFALAVAHLKHRGRGEALRAAVAGRKGMDCERCGAKKSVTVSLAQVRSADEGETAFYRCEQCRATWHV